MRKFTRWTRLAAVTVLVTAGCKSLEVTNPNNPDAARAFSDPGAVAGLVTGAIRNWVQTRQTYDGPLVLEAMADAYTASWNNFNLRYYSSFGVECPARCGWDNNPTSNYRFEVETLWYGFYGLLSSVNDVLIAIRKNNVTITDAANTKMLEAASVMVQGVVFANIALHYDQGFVVTEATDLADPLSLPLVSRAVLRDSAIAKFDQAATLITAAGFSATPSTWLGATNGPSFSSAQLVKLVKTMQAEVLAMYPRNAAENATVNWGQVATYASGGLSSGAPLDVEFYNDYTNMIDGTKAWGNDVTTMRVDTRLARNITAGPDPAKVHKDPWPDPAGNPQPNAFDKRVGDGSWGPADNFLGVGTVQQTANGGTDFAWAGRPIFPSARGQYHQSNLGNIRYSYLAYPGYGLPTEDGKGLTPVYTATLNDLLWAEGLIRSGGNAAQAAGLINKTRVTRGGLSALTGGEGTPAMLAALQYEQDIELLGMGSEPFFNRRRIDGLLAMTPRQMPIPAKELDVLKREFYSFGGPGNPAGLAPGVDGNGNMIIGVRERGEALLKAALQQARRHRRN